MGTKRNDVSSPNGVNGQEGSVRGRLVPRQFRRLKRFGILAGCLLVGLACLRLWWGFEAHRRLAAEIERYQAAGQLVYASEFDAVSEAIPGEDNAALLLEEAINAITFTTESGVQFIDFMDESDAFDSKPGAAEELVKSNSNVLRLVRQARSMRQVAWSQRLQHSATGFTPGAGSGQRSLARLLWFAASYHYRTGNHLEAVETTHDLLAFSEAIDAHPTLLSTLVGWACYDLGVRLLEDFGASLSVDRAMVDREDGVRSASRAQVKKLIDSMLREDNTRQALIRSLHGDRALALDRLDSIEEFGVGALTGNVFRSPSRWSRAIGFIGKPLLVLDTLREIRLSSLAAEAAADDNWPEAAKHFPSKAKSPSLLRSVTRPLTDSPFGVQYATWERCIELHFKHLARRRMGATALAIRLFEVDHGHRPADLNALVPDYLPAVPIDPFSGGGATIGYKPAAKRPVLYSIGPNGVDNSGVMARGPDKRIDYGKSDIVFYLDGKIRGDRNAVAGSSSETDPEYEDGKDEEGQARENQPSQDPPK